MRCALHTGAMYPTLNTEGSPIVLLPMQAYSRIHFLILPSYLSRRTGQRSQSPGFDQLQAPPSKPLWLGNGSGKRANRLLACMDEELQKTDWVHRCNQNCRVQTCGKHTCFTIDCVRHGYLSNPEQIGECYSSVRPPPVPVPPTPGPFDWVRPWYRDLRRPPSSLPRRVLAFLGYR